MQSESTISNPDCEIVSSRVFNFSRALVFRAWTEPEHLKIWWGPAGFTNTFHEFDLRPGGTWKLTMHGPEKGNYENESRFIRIETPSLIEWQRISKPVFRVLTTFEEIAEDKTRVIFRMIFETEQECDKIRKFAPEKNEENFDRLEEELKKMV